MHPRDPHPRPAWPNALVLILCVLAPTLGLLAWVFGNEAPGLRQEA